MRREKRFTRNRKSNNLKYLLYLSSGMLVIILLTFVITFVVYNNKLKDSAYKALETKEIAKLIPDLDVREDTESASTEIGKSIDDVIKEAENKVEEKMADASNNDVKDDIILEKNNTEIEKIEEIPAQQTVQVVKDPEFAYPVEGDIVREFAKDNYIYSYTLEEWVTHLGVDIKTERATVVKAAETGTIVAIKNDPRYGLTVIIEHTNGYKSIYSNLLTAEFIKEGEVVEKSQTIGTVGNSASFEIADEPHLHFEILKDNENVDPRAYIR